MQIWYIRKKLDYRKIQIKMVDTPSENTNNQGELETIPYEVIYDKSLTTQDHLFKLVIIGDTGNFYYLH